MSTHLSFGKDLSRCFGCRSNDPTGETSLSTLVMTISATIKAAVVLVIPSVVAAANEIKPSIPSARSLFTHGKSPC